MVDDDVGIVVVFMDDVVLNGFMWVSYMYCKV